MRRVMLIAWASKWPGSNGTRSSSPVVAKWACPERLNVLVLVSRHTSLARLNPRKRPPTRNGNGESSQSAHATMHAATGTLWALTLVSTRTHVPRTVLVFTSIHRQSGGAVPDGRGHRGYEIQARVLESPIASTSRTRRPAETQPRARGYY